MELLEKLICAAIIVAMCVYGYAAFRSIVDVTDNLTKTCNELTEMEDDQ